jgi:hypothetical protein
MTTMVPRVEVVVVAAAATGPTASSAGPDGLMSWLGVHECLGVALSRPGGCRGCAMQVKSLIARKSLISHRTSTTASPAQGTMWYHDDHVTC